MNINDEIQNELEFQHGATADNKLFQSIRNSQINDVEVLSKLNDTYEEAIYVEYKESIHDFIEKIDNEFFSGIDDELVATSLSSIFKAISTSWPTSRKRI